MSADVEYTRAGIQIGDVTLSPSDMVAWFEDFNQVDHYFEDHFPYDDLVTPGELEEALEDQREDIMHRLPEFNPLFHDDAGHTGTIKWCGDPVCRFNYSAEEVWP